MSNDLQNPEDKPDGKPKPPSKSRKDSTEDDLWDLEDDSPSKEKPPAAEPSAIPSRRKSESSVESRTPVERHTEGPVPSKKAADPPKEETSEKTGVTEEEPKDPEKTSEPEKPKQEVSPPDSDDTEADTEKPASKSAVATSGFLASLTKTEKIGISALAAILALTAIYGIVHFNSRIPVKPLVPAELELPVKGKRMTVTSVETYWRAPVSGGDNPDIVQRGVKLIPAIKINLKESSGAIRVLFRNEEGSVVGDNISRTIDSGGTIEVAGTAGFEDAGMHAAYRTGNSDRWTVHVLEGSDVNAPIEKFDSLLKTKISANVR